MTRTDTTSNRGHARATLAAQGRADRAHFESAILYVCDRCRGDLLAGLWLDELSAAGLPSYAPAWRAEPTLTDDRVTAGQYRRFTTLARRMRTNTVVIGQGAGAEVAERLLADGYVAAAVSIGSTAARRTFAAAGGPLLLIHSSDSVPSDENSLRQARMTRICDQEIFGADRPALTAGHAGSQLADYIRGWLDFHNLALTHTPVHTC